jgi:hypothetical protein
MGASGSLVFKALGYKQEGHGFETQWGEILNLPNPSGLTRPSGFIQPLSEISTGNIKKKKIFWGVEWCWQPYHHLWAIVLESSDG